MNIQFKPCLLIPVYNHRVPLIKIIEHLSTAGLPCLLIDDGSDAECAQTIQHLAQQYDWVKMQRLDVNQGKGGAVKAGILLAESLGYSHAIQIDADGQHDLDDLSLFISTARQSPDAVISGRPIYDQSIPKLRYYGRFLTHVWVYINTLSLAIPDAMCGYRVYPIRPCAQLIKTERLENRMAFDVEILVKLYWQGLQVIALPTHVGYPQDGVSHFRGLEDNWRISMTHARLFFGMLARLPKLLARHFQ